MGEARTRAERPAATTHESWQTRSIRYCSGDAYDKPARPAPSSFGSVTDAARTQTPTHKHKANKTYKPIA